MRVIGGRNESGVPQGSIEFARVYVDPTTGLHYMFPWQVSTTVLSPGLNF